MSTNQEVIASSKQTEHWMSAGLAVGELTGFIGAIAGSTFACEKTGLGFVLMGIVTSAFVL